MSNILKLFKKILKFVENQECQTNFKYLLFDNGDSVLNGIKKYCYQSFNGINIFSVKVSLCESGFFWTFGKKTHGEKNSKLNTFFNLGSIYPEVVGFAPKVEH